MVATDRHQAHDLSEESRSKIGYIRQMLGELRGVAEDENADMLCYLLEMAFTEAGDILSGRRTLSCINGQRHEPTGVPLQPPGKIKF